MKHVKKQIFLACLSGLIIFGPLQARHSFNHDQHVQIENNEIFDPEHVLIGNKEYVSLSQEQENDRFYHESSAEIDFMGNRIVNSQKKYTIVIFMAADNDLHPFAWKNIKQMEAIGSNDNINIIVQLNTPGYFNPTKRYVIKQGRRVLIQAEGPIVTQKLNSGSPHTLIDCVAWAMKYYPAEHLILNFWDHGSGIWDPGTSKTINVCDLFYVNPATKMLELDRNIEYIDHVEQSSDVQQKQRGICFDETYKSFMTNQDLKFALHEIQNKVLDGKKIAVAWFDACLMSMVEIADICKDHVDYLVASEDVEYASGSNYQLVLSPFLHRAISPREFACHVVESFGKAYQQITKDFTQSAVDLSQMSFLETNIHLVAEQLLLALQNQRDKSVGTMVLQSKSRLLCTCFEEPSFIDLRHFYINLQANLSQISLVNMTQEIAVKDTLARLLEQGINFINCAVIANATGSNLANACGLSIYFPEKAIFNSYLKCNFAQSNNWGALLKNYIIQNK